MPLVEEETSKTAEGSGVVVPIPTLFWARTLKERSKKEKMDIPNFLIIEIFG